METFINDIYRVIPDMDRSWLTHGSHWAVAVGFILLFRYFLTNYEDLQNKDRIRVVWSRILPVFLLFRFGLNREYYSLAEQWPLYTCNLSAIILALNYLIPRKEHRTRHLLSWGVFAGAYGGPLAIALASPGNYAFPHVTHLDYYIGHLAITILSWMIIMDREERYTLQDLKTSSYITVAYMILCLVLNPPIQGNFGFIMGPPDAMSFLHALPLPIYQIIVTLGFLTANALTWYLGNKVIDRESEVEPVAAGVENTESEQAAGA